MRSILTTIIFTVCALGAQAAPQISAQLQPDRIALGESARLIVTLSGSGSNARPEIPRVDGLRIQPAGQSSQVRIVNGQTSRTVGFTYRVTADRSGEFEIPSITAQSLKTEPLALHVEAASRQLAPQAPALPGGSAPSPGAIKGAGTEGLAFLRVERADNGERDHLYVGELTPIAIRAFFREGVQISQLSKPVLEGGAFTLHQLSDEPQQQSATIDGQRYRVLSWFAGLSGVKAGEENLVASLPATLGLPQQRQSQRPPRKRQSPFGSSLFDDPFFDSVFDDFFQRVEHREVTLTSEATALTILTLPQEGRPESFDGAVGQFQLGHFSIPAELATGDPAELQINVNGKGNFDRVTAPQLLPEGKWKTYSAKDRTEAGDSIGYKASKTFTLPAIALEPGDYPASFSFDYFDPESGKYQTITTEPMPVTVTGAAVSPDEPGEANVAAATSPEGEILAPPRSDPGRIVTNPRAPYSRTWFIALQAVPAGALIAAACIGVARRRSDDPVIAKKRAMTRAIDSQLAGMATARQRQDGLEFFACARRALQHKLAAQWGGKPEAITSEELRDRLPNATELARVFQMADAVEFSGTLPHPDSFGEWQDRVEAAMREIETPADCARSTAKPSWGEVPQTT